MSMYTPGIKEELSEEAKMLVEDGGKVFRTAIPKSENVPKNYVFYTAGPDSTVCKDDLYNEKLTHEEMTRIYDEWVNGANIAIFTGNSLGMGGSWSVYRVDSIEKLANDSGGKTFDYVLYSNGYSNIKFYVHLND